MSVKTVVPVFLPLAAGVKGKSVVEFFWSNHPFNSLSVLNALPDFVKFLQSDDVQAQNLVWQWFLLGLRSILKRDNRRKRDQPLPPWETKPSNIIFLCQKTNFFLILLLFFLQNIKLQNELNSGFIGLYRKIKGFFSRVVDAILWC